MAFPIDFPVIETKRLKLRRLVADDRDAYFALYSDIQVHRTWGTLGHQSPEETLALIHYLDSQFEKSTGIRWGVELKFTGELIGDIGFWRIVPERHRAEIGAKLGTKYWSGGFMTEAMRSVVECAFELLGMNSIEANIDPTNRAAIRMVEKVGFVKEGYIREHSFSPYENRYLDTELYSIVKSHWKPYEGTL